MERNRPLTQQYANYTAEDFTVWNTLFERQIKLLHRYANNDYLTAIDKIGFTAKSIPNFGIVNKTLDSLTGWQLTVVPGLVPQKDFFQLLAQRIFPATCWLRTFAELDYIEEPDMFHDVFGHVPLLANRDYANFMQSFGRLALDYADDAEVINLLSRIYWFTVEFGLIKNKNDMKIYGAGILSSPGETMHSMKPETLKHDFNTLDILNTNYRTDVMQDQYFVIDNFKQLDNMLIEAKSILSRQRTNLLSTAQNISI